MQNSLNQESTQSDEVKSDGDINELKQRLASHPETHPQVLELLAVDKSSPEVLERVAENSHTASETLEKLAAHDAPEVRGAVTENENASHEILAALAADEHPDVRFRVADNPNTPAHILESLTEDENPYVVSRANQTLESVKCVSERANDLLLQEHYAEAEHAFKLLVAGLEELLGPAHIEVANAMHKLAAALHGQDKAAEALQVEEKAQILQSVHGATN